jgi:predicted patatin/cPLA2 family phospholipase
METQETHNCINPQLNPKQLTPILKNNSTFPLNPKKILNLIFLLLSYTILSALTPKATCGPNNKCYILALEGGGDKGAYQAGVIAGLIENLNTTQTQYDVVTGISVGAINAAGFSIFSIGSERAAAEFLLNYWREIKGKSSIFENWMFGPLQGLLTKTGIYSTEPLHKLLQTLIAGESIKRKIIIGSTDISNGTYKTWDEDDFSSDKDSFVTSIMASSAFPVIFPNIQKDGASYMDGGVKNSIDIVSGINKCLDMGYSMESIVIDAILCSASNMLPQVDLSKMHPVSILIRVFEIYGYDNSMRGLEDILYD